MATQHVAPNLLVLGCQSPALTAAKLYLKQDQSQKAKEQLVLALETDDQVQTLSATLMI